jgi:hypothetical protein
MDYWKQLYAIESFKSKKPDKNETGQVREERCRNL